MYLLARQWGIQPGEFWDMTIGEWWAEYDVRAPADDTRYAGKLTRRDVDDLLAWTNEKAKDG